MGRHFGQNVLEFVVLRERMRCCHMKTEPRDTYKSHMEEITGSLWNKYRNWFLRRVREQSKLMKAICLIWGRGRHFCPSLPDRGPTGIWNSAHSISDPRAEISGILVIARRSSATARGNTYWFKLFWSWVPEFRLRMHKLSELNSNSNSNIYFYSANSTIQFSNALYNSSGNQINIAQIIIFTIIIHKSNQIMVFDERGKPEYPGENLS